jgi:hypothetical protein
MKQTLDDGEDNGIWFMCSPSIGSLNGHHYNNFGHQPLDISIEWSGTHSFVIFVSFHVSTSYRIN